MRCLSGDLPGALAELEILLERPDGRHAPVYLQAADMALAGGDFLRCRAWLAETSKQEDFAELMPEERAQWEALEEKVL